MSDDFAADRLAQEVAAARNALLEAAADDRERWQRASELKARARNGWGSGAMSIAMAELLDEGRFEVGEGMRVRLAH